MLSDDQRAQLPISNQQQAGQRRLQADQLGEAVDIVTGQHLQMCN